MGSVMSIAYAAAISRLAVVVLGDDELAADGAARGLLR